MSCCKKNNCCKGRESEAVQDYLVCTCMGVMRSEIIDAIKSGTDTFEGLSEELGVGTGCSSCVEEVHQMLDKYRSKGCCSK